MSGRSEAGRRDIEANITVAPSLAAVLAWAAAPRVYRWADDARPEQLPPEGDWRVWNLRAGRGSGKTRTGAETTVEELLRGRDIRCAVVSRTFAAARDDCVEGESGILAALARRGYRDIRQVDRRSASAALPERTYRWNRSFGLLRLANGSRAQLYSAEEPDRMRGPQYHFAWCDEAAAWKHLAAALANLRFGLRLGSTPRMVITSTPRPLRILRDIEADPHTVTRIFSTYANRENLPEAYLEEVDKVARTRLGRQEVLAEMLSDTPGALWTGDMIERAILTGVEAREAEDLGRYKRVVVAIDPAGRSSKDADETGIIVAGELEDAGGFVVMADRSGRYSPGEWARVAVDAYREYRADRIVAEVNNGWDMVRHTVRTVDRSAVISEVVATRGKRLRAEPIAALYELGEVKHLGGLAELEDQLTTWVQGDESPDRLDALVWALTSLAAGRLRPPRRQVIREVN